MGTLDTWNEMFGKWKNKLKILDTLAKAREYAGMHVLNFGMSML